MWEVVDVLEPLLEIAVRVIAQAAAPNNWATLMHWRSSSLRPQNARGNNMP